MKLRKLICGVMAALMLATAGGAVLAAETYQETVLPLAKAHTDKKGQIPISWYFTYGDGNIDYFFFQRMKARSGTPEWYHSGDGGKTWQQKDMSWHAAIQEQAQQNVIQENMRLAKEKPGIGVEMSSGQAGKIESIYLSKTGVPYFLIQMETKYQEFGKEGGKRSATSRPEYEIYKVKDGKAQRIPNVVVGEPVLQKKPFQSYAIVGAEEGKEVTVLYQEHAGGSSDNKMRFTRYDEATGKQIGQTPEISSWDGSYIDAGNLFYVNEYVQNDGYVAAYDMTTGAKVRSVPVPSEKNRSSYVENLGSSPDGTVYLINECGLYRLAPGATEMTKLIDSAGTQLEGDRVWVMGRLGLACTDDGKVYVMLAKDSVADKLMCYSPK